MTDRTEILQKITNLRARAEDSASSEAEAMTAANHAAKLMDRFEVEESELALGEITFAITSQEVRGYSGTGRGRRVVRHKATACATAIAALTKTEVVRTGSNIEFTGDKPDVEMACYLFEMIRNTMDHEYEKWRRSLPHRVPQGAKASFQLAMGTRVNERLSQITRSYAEERTRLANEGNTSAQNALVLVDKKKEAVSQFFNVRYPKLRKSTGFTYRRNSTAWDSGYKAGNKVGFNRPVGKGESKRLLK